MAINPQNTTANNINNTINTQQSLQVEIKKGMTSSGVSVEAKVEHSTRVTNNKTASKSLLLNQNITARTVQENIQGKLNEKNFKQFFEALQGSGFNSKNINKVLDKKNFGFFSGIKDSLIKRFKGETAYKNRLESRSNKQADGVFKELKKEVFGNKNFSNFIQNNRANKEVMLGMLQTLYGANKEEAEGLARLLGNVPTKDFNTMVGMLKDSQSTEAFRGKLLNDESGRQILTNYIQKNRNNQDVMVGLAQALSPSVFDATRDRDFLNNLNDTDIANFINVLKINTFESSLEKIIFLQELVSKNFSDIAFQKENLSDAKFDSIRKFSDFANNLVSVEICKNDEFDRDRSSLSNFVFGRRLAEATSRYKDMSKTILEDMKKLEGNVDTKKRKEIEQHKELTYQEFKKVLNTAKYVDEMFQTCYSKIDFKRMEVNGKPIGDYDYGSLKAFSMSSLLEFAEHYDFSYDLREEFLSTEGKTFLTSVIKENQNNDTVMKGLEKIVGSDSFSVMVIKNVDAGFKCCEEAKAYLEGKVNKHDANILPFLRDLDTCDQKELQVALNRFNDSQPVKDLDIMKDKISTLFGDGLNDEQTIEQLKNIQIVKDVDRNYEFSITLGENKLKIENVGDKEAIARNILDQVKKLNNISNDEKLRLTDFLFNCPAQGLLANKTSGGLFYHFEGNGNPIFDVTIGKDGNLSIELNSSGRNDKGYAQLGLQVKFSPSVDAKVEFKYGKEHSVSGKVDNIEVKNFKQTWDENSVSFYR